MNLEIVPDANVRRIIDGRHYSRWLVVDDAPWQSFVWVEDGALEGAASFTIVNVEVVDDLPEMYEGSVIRHASQN